MDQAYSDAGFDILNGDLSGYVNAFTKADPPKSLFPFSKAFADLPLKFEPGTHFEVIVRAPPPTHPLFFFASTLNPFSNKLMQTIINTTTTRRRTNNDQNDITSNDATTQTKYMNKAHVYFALQTLSLSFFLVDSTFGLLVVFSWFLSFVSLLAFLHFFSVIYSRLHFNISSSPLHASNKILESLTLSFYCRFPLSA